MAVRGECERYEDKRDEGGERRRVEVQGLREGDRELGR